MGQAAVGHVLALEAGGRRVGLPSRLVREILRLPRLTRVPQAPGALLGLANVRGAVMPVLSLARLLGLDSGAERRLVVLDSGEPVGLAIDAVAESLRADEAASLEIVDALGLVGTVIAGERKPARATAGSKGTAVVETAGETVSLVTFAVAAQTFALPIEAVEEVLRVPEAIAPVPNAAPMVLGSTDLHGAVLPLLALAELLALLRQALSPRSRVLVVRIGAHMVGFVVDAVHTTVRVAASDIDPVPLVLTRGDAEAQVQAVCRLGGGKLVSVLAPQHLLREDLSRQLLRASAADRKVVRAPKEQTEPLLLFRVGNADYGLPLATVERVSAVPATMARPPRSPAFLRGVITIAGEAVPVIDQARRFGGVASAGNQRLIVTRSERLRAAFLVDAVSDVRRLPRSAIQAAPNLGDEETRVFARAIPGSDGASTTLILDPGELLDGTERAVLRALVEPAAASRP